MWKTRGWSDKGLCVQAKKKKHMGEKLKAILGEVVGDRISKMGEWKAMRNIKMEGNPF